MKSTSAIFVWALCSAIAFHVGCSCIPRDGCSAALLIYNIIEGDTVNNISQRFNTNQSEILKYNNLSNVNLILTGANLRIPFPCNCLDNGMLGHHFAYTLIAGDTLAYIADTLFQHYSQSGWIAIASKVDENNVKDGGSVQVPVNCSCGNPKITSYGLFATYAIRQNDTEDNISSTYNVTKTLLEYYNGDVDWRNLTVGEDLIYFPAQEKNGSYRAFSGNFSTLMVARNNILMSYFFVMFLLRVVSCQLMISMFAATSKHKNKIGFIVGVVGACFASVIIAIGAFLSWGKCRHHTSCDAEVSLTGSIANDQDPKDTLYKSTSAFIGDKALEFSYEELAAATDNFNISHEIGLGGYGAVYFGEIQGQTLAIKKMNIQASKEFLSEVNVLTHVHHKSLVQLIGYCAMDSLFLVYEYIDNGTLADHLHKAGKQPLSWNARLQIALDAARGLVYIHQHTKPAYIHRDVKSSNILVDKDFHAKIADFGLTKWRQAGKESTSLTQSLTGTFGYMAPEYCRFGEVSSKVDVYAFGVVLFELISGKQAIVEARYFSGDVQQEGLESLVQVFDPVMKDASGKEKLRRLVDPKLGSDYPLKSAWKLAKLAEECTRETPENRPTMRTVVVALMSLSSSISS